MNDCIKSGSQQVVAVIDLAGQEDDGRSGCVSAGGLQDAIRDLAGQRLLIRLAFSGNDKAALSDTIREMDGIQDRLDAGVHFSAQAHGEGGADPAGCAGARQMHRIDAKLLFPGLRLPAEPPFQFFDAMRVRPFLRAEYGRCAVRSGKGNVNVVKCVDPDGSGKGSEGLQETRATVHDRRPAKANPNLFDSLLYSILHQFTCTDG